MLGRLNLRLKDKVLILGIGNTLRSDDGAGSLLASRIRDKVPYIVYDAGPNPENYLGKIIKDKPDVIVILDAADFGGKPGELREMEIEGLKATNLFSTHNAPISLTINYLQNNLKVDIITLLIQPKTITFGDKLSREVEDSLGKLEDWFYAGVKKAG